MDTHQIKIKEHIHLKGDNGLSSAFFAHPFSWKTKHNDEEYKKLPQM